MRPIVGPGSDTPATTWHSLVRGNRERLQMTQDRLAELLSVSRKTISRWENSTYTPETMETALRAIKILGIDREIGLRAAGFGVDEGQQPDPYAWVREMGLDPNNRVVRYILNANISDGLRMAALKRERELQLQDEQRRLETAEWLFRQEAS
jgi:DNA-binding XRE family transcriptional regulator